MIIRVERSGGVTGIITSNQIDTADLSPPMVIKVRKLIENANLSQPPMKKVPQGAADHYVYKITIQDGSNQQVVECNQYNINENMKLLIRYVEGHMTK